MLKIFAVAAVILFKVDPSLAQDTSSPASQVEVTVPATPSGETPPPTSESASPSPPVSNPTNAGQPPVEANSTAAPYQIRILAKGTGVPVRRAKIRVGESDVFSGPDGIARINPSKGSKDIEVSRNGFKTEFVEVSQLNEGQVLDVYLYPGTPDDNEVIIRGARRQETSRKVVSAQESKQLVPTGDPAQIIKLLPGVQTAGFRPEVIVRGSGPNDSRYYVDQLSVPYIFHTFGNLSIIEPNQLNEVEFYSGGFGVQNGNAMGGIVTLRTKDEIPERAMTEATVNLPFFSAVFHERPLSDNSFLTASVRRSYIDYFLEKFVAKRLDSTIAPYFGDAQIAYTKKEGDLSTKFSLLGSYDGLRLLVNSPNGGNEEGKADFSIYNGFVVAGYEIKDRLSDGWQYSSTPQVSWTKIRQDINEFKVNIDSYRAGVPIEFTKRLSPKEKLYLGLDPAINYFYLDILVPEPRGTDPTYDFEEAPKVTLRRLFKLPELATWAAIDRQFGDFLVQPGLRVFYNEQIHRTSYDPRLLGRYAVNSENTVKGAVGQYSQDPGEGAEASEEFGNPNLDFQRAIHYVLGLETTWSDLWTTEFQVFHKKAFHLVRSDSQTRYSNAGSMRSTGAEAFIRRNATARMFGWISYTYSKTEERDTDEESFRPAQYDQTHVANFAANYRFTGQFQLGTVVGYHTGARYTPVSDAVYNANLDKYQPRNNLADRYSSRLPDFYQVDLFAQNDALYDTTKLIFRYGVQYLALQRQVFSVQRNYDYSKEEYFRGIPPIPYFEVKGQF